MFRPLFTFKDLFSESQVAQSETEDREAQIFERTRGAARRNRRRLLNICESLDDSSDRYCFDTD